MAAKGNTSTLTTAIFGHVRAWACLLVAAVAISAIPAVVHATTLATASAAENSPLGFARNSAPSRALANRLQAPESPLESAFAYGQIVVDNAYATRGAVTAAPKLLSSIPARVVNAANHIFGPKSLGKHNLGPVLNAFKGDATAAFYQLENAAQTLANQGAIRGVFQTTVEAAGYQVTVRGAVIDGIAQLSTAFIP